MEDIGGIHTKIPVPRLLMNLECQKRYQMNALAIYYYSEKRDENNSICNFMYSNDIIKNKTEKNVKLKR